MTFYLVLRVAAGAWAVVFFFSAKRFSVHT